MPQIYGLSNEIATHLLSLSSIKYNYYGRFVLLEMNSKNIAYQYISKNKSMHCRDNWVCLVYNNLHLNAYMHMHVWSRTLYGN